MHADTGCPAIAYPKVRPRPGSRNVPRNPPRTLRGASRQDLIDFFEPYSRRVDESNGDTLCSDAPCSQRTRCCLPWTGKC